MSYDKLLALHKSLVTEYPDFAASRNNLDDHPGMTYEIAERFGLGKKELKRLEKLGLAIRGRTKNIWTTGETTPSGHEVEKGVTYRGKGSRTRWLVLKD